MSQGKIDVYEAELIQQGIGSSFWKEYLVPRMQDQINSYKDALVYCIQEEVIPLQTKIKMLEEWIKKPYRDLKSIQTGGQDER